MASLFKLEVNMNFKLGHGIMSALIILGLSACAGQTTPLPATDQQPVQTPGSQEQPQVFRFGNPVVSESQALTGTRAALGGSYKYTEPLQVVSVQQTSYGEYSKLLGGGSNQPEDMKVWLVIYLNAGWQNISALLGVTPTPSFHGCVSVVIDARDGLPVEVGGPIMRGIMVECDQNSN